MLAEITTVIGYFGDKQTLYCQMTEVDPGITAAVPLHIFETLHLPRKQVLSKNFKQVLKSFSERGVICHNCNWTAYVDSHNYVADETLTTN